MSISHDVETFKIYVHYASFERAETRFYMHSIKRAYFTEPEDRWIARRFTRNVYDVFLPLHLERVCSILDSLPEDASIWGQLWAAPVSETNESSSTPQATAHVIPSTPALDDGPLAVVAGSRRGYCHLTATQPGPPKILKRSRLIPYIFCPTFWMASSYRCRL